MNNYIKILIGAGLLAGMVSCSKESPFNMEDSEGMGRLMKSAINVDLRIDEQISRSDNNVNIDDFVVSFYEDGADDPYVTYTYGEMPEVVSLPAGIYKASATLGDDPEAAFDSPYYLGESGNFRIVADEVTTDIGDVVCRLSNVKVSVVFDDALTLAMSADTKVNIRMDNGEILSFTKNDEELGRAGYFRYVPNMEMSANFIGEVEGWQTNETKVYSTINNGTHYRLTFRLHSDGNPENGDADAALKVDASVTGIDVERNVVVAEDPILDDNERPGTGTVTPPNPPTPPTGDGPSVVGGDGTVFDTPIPVTDGFEPTIKVHSETGLTGFTVDIISDALTPSELAGVGLSDHLDLVNPGDLSEVLSNLGFPVNLGGEKDVTFVISSQFMMLMQVFGSQTHEFKLTITDASGTVVKSLILQF